MLGGPFTDMYPKYIIIHCATTDTDKAVDWNEIVKYYPEAKIHSDAAYYFGVDPLHDNAKSVIGHPYTGDGAYCHDYANVRSICIISKTQPTDEQLAPLYKILRNFLTAFGLSKDKVLGHWEACAILGQDTKMACSPTIDMNAFRGKL
jgi:hypothetical protein